MTKLSLPPDQTSGYKSPFLGGVKRKLTHLSLIGFIWCPLFDPLFWQSHWKYIDSGFQREPLLNEGYKRKRLSPDNSEDTDFNDNVIKVLRRNSNILKAHLGAQNINSQLARDQQKQQTDSLVAALGKLTDALTKIADKL